MTARLVVLVSGAGTNLQALLDACADSAYGAAVVAVGADRTGIEGLARARRDALAYGVKVTGCTVFLVDAGTDTGPVIAQAVVPIREDDDEATLHERIKVA